MKLTFSENYDLTKVRPASYNPRKINPNEFAELRRSVATLGLIKPILVNATNNVLVAGHQRSKALEAEGHKQAPAMLLPKVSPGQEMKFNQLHNAADANFSEIEVRVGPQEGTGYRWIESGQIELSCKPAEVAGANFRHSLMSMMQRFGPWGSVVCAPSGQVLVSKQYAICAKILGMNLLAYVLPPELREECLRFFSRTYGHYTYEDKAAHVFNQSYCQFARGVANPKPGQTPRTSPLYERHLLPLIRRDMHILDLGAGKKDYARKLTASGHKVIAIEFFERIPNSTQLNIPELQRSLEVLRQHLASGQLFDLVLSDVVISSCSTQQREDDLLHTLHALCRPGGVLAFSGRQVERVHAQNNAKRMVNTKVARRAIDFLDANNITAIHKQGFWMFQKYHDDAQRRALGQKYIGQNYRMTTYSGCFQISGVKRTALARQALVEAMRRQFDLPLPSGRTVGWHDKILSAWSEAAGRPQNDAMLAVPELEAGGSEATDDEASEG